MKHLHQEMIVAVNTGSSSIKASIFEVKDSNELSLLTSIKAAVKLGSLEFSITGCTGQVLNDMVRPIQCGKGSSHEEAMLSIFFDELKKYLPTDNVAFGHRVVHGGLLHITPIVINPDNLIALKSLIPLAPLHQEQSLAAIRMCSERYPSVPQIACFDTAFHRTHSWVNEVYALPGELTARGIRRYGFHGISCESIVSKLKYISPTLLEGRIVIAHLGNGSSLSAVRASKSVASSMGFTPLDGLPMGTRSGQIDPGVLLYLMQTENMSPDEVADLLYHRSGLLGISGISSDLRVLLESRESSAYDAIRYYVQRIVCGIGEMSAALGGIDGIVFTGGIGEHASTVRREIIDKLRWLGFDINEIANEVDNGQDRLISSYTSRAAVWVIPTDEEKIIAEHTINLIGE